MSKLSLRNALPALGFLLVYFYAGRLGILIHQQTGYPPVIWIPSGLGLALMVLCGASCWPLVFLGAFLVTFIAHAASLATTLFVAAGSTLEALLGAFLLKRTFNRRIEFTTINEILGFLVLVMIVANGIGATLEVGGPYLLGEIKPDEFFPTWRSWWLGRAVGNLFIGILLINFWNDARFRLLALRARYREGLSLALAVAIIASVVFTSLALENKSLLIKPYFLFSLMLWTSIRFELVGATFANAIIVTSAIVGMHQGFSAFPTYAPFDRVVIFQFYLSALSLTGLIVAASGREKTEAIEARNEFLGVASHELKTPITSLKLNLQMLRRRILQKNDRTPAEDEYVNAIGKVDRQINRLVAIVEQLLDVSQANRTKFELQREEVDLGALVRALAERLSGAIASARTSLEMKLDPDLRGDWDPFRIEQVLENLLSNALKYAPGKPVSVETFRSGGNAVIVVRDEGPGIDDAKKPYIFDRFVRASQNPHVQGLGLGLFITRQIVQAHGGRISVESGRGNGTRFEIHLPLAAPGAAA